VLSLGSFVVLGLAALGPAVTVLALIVVAAELTLNRLAPVAALAVGKAAVRGATEEGGRALEGLTDRPAGQPGLVLPVPGQLPLLAAGRERVKPWLGH
jgi:hypothetical protein